MFDFAKRQNFPLFHYHSYQYRFENDTKLIITFDFEIEGLCSFKPETTISFPNGFKNTITPEFLCNLVFHFGLVEMISYWKATCSPLIKIHCGYLEKLQINFWQDLFFQGLGEFRYKNNMLVSANDFVHFECDAEAKDTKMASNYPVTNQLIMVPIGGGKDSIVTLEILCRNKHTPLLFFLNPRESTFKIAETSQIPAKNWVIINRQIDQNLLKLNEQGYLNGHTPFSALLAFMTILVGVPLGVQSIMLSNENSANEGNVTFNGQIVNHQYSKTYDFEKKFIKYSQKYLTKQTQYFSFLRPLKELAIARLFTKYTKYHTHFKSCNVGQKKDVWCGNCPKCLFVWVILSPWLSLEEMVNIFKKNIWLDLSQLDTLKELAGLSGIKPFECVGTSTEVRAALTLCQKKYGKTQLPLLSSINIDDFQFNEEEISKEHKIPKPYWEMLKHELSS
jgi:hypothetical protein